MRELADKEQQVVIERLWAEYRRLGCKTQKEFARIIGLSPAFTNLIMSGNRLGIRSLRKIAQNLKRPLDYFLSPVVAEESEPYRSNASELDENLLKAIMDKTFQLLKKSKKNNLTSDQLSKLFTKLYAHYYDTGELPDETEIEKYLLLVN